MEEVLDVYKRPYNKDFPVICMDESPRQLIEEVQNPIPCSLGHSARHDYEYQRNGTCNIFMANEPLAGKRLVQVTTHRTSVDWAFFMKEISEAYEDAEKITLVLDNLNTHKAASFYEAFEASHARALRQRFEWVYTPKHGSWLNMAEIELRVLAGQCLNRRIADIEKMRQEVAAWQRARDEGSCKINWHFATSDARVKLKRLYPSISCMT